MISDIDEIDAVGHRVLHGGEKFTESVIINDEVEKTIEEYCDLGPLHNPHNLTGIRVCKKLLPGKPQVAVFDLPSIPLCRQRPISMHYLMSIMRNIRLRDMAFTAHHTVMSAGVVPS